jgi:polyisoprenoid-binding protein YceI
MTGVPHNHNKEREMKKLFLSFVFAISLATASAFAADTYKIDGAHSSVAFSVKHMMLSHTHGQFDKLDGMIMYDPKDLVNSKIDVTIDATSIDTHNDKRDGHLKSEDFLDAAKFPTITFVSKKITDSEIVGDLTIKGVTKEVSIPATITGPVKGMGGNNVIAINGAFVLNRQDFGVKWNKSLDQGGVAVSDEVNVDISVEAAQ